MTLSPVPGAFDHSPDIRSLTQDEALATLRRAAEAGLVHSVSNNQEGIWYICNCCTCSCGDPARHGRAGHGQRGRPLGLRQPGRRRRVHGLRRLRGALPVRRPDAGRTSSRSTAVRCVGCGVCVPVCPENALVPRAPARGRGAAAAGHRSGLALGARRRARVGFGGGVVGKGNSANFAVWATARVALTAKRICSSTPCGALALGTHNSTRQAQRVARR